RRPRHTGAPHEVVPVSAPPLCPRAPTQRRPVPTLALSESPTRGGEMSHMNRRELVGAAGVVAAAGLVPAVAAAATGKSHNEGPTLPKSDESNKFDFAKIEP